LSLTQESDIKCRFSKVSKYRFDVKEQDNTGKSKLNSDCRNISDKTTPARAQRFFSVLPLKQFSCQSTEKCTDENSKGRKKNKPYKHADNRSPYAEF